MEMANSNGAGAVLPMVFIVFLILKLTHVIGWSWWWVCAPLLIPIGIGIIFAIIVSLVLAIYAACSGKNYMELIQKAQNSFKP